MANLSKIKRDSLIDKIENLKMKNKKDEDTTLLLNEIINELTGKKYGLVWELHEENVDKKMETAIPVFDEIKEREICGNPNDKKINFLLEGDNLHSLKLLEKTHKGRIDVIYIDPPYNTGNSFTYSGSDDNIDKYAKKKFDALKEYARHHHINFGFVRNKNVDDVPRLFLNNTEYTDEMTDNWKRLENFF